MSDWNGTCPGCGDFCNDGSGAGRCERCQSNEMNYGPYEFDQDRWA